MDAKEFHEPFRHWVIEGFLEDPGECPRVHSAVPRPDWPHWVRYANDCEWGKRTCRDTDQLPAAAACLLYRLNEPARVQQLEQLTGVADLVPDRELHGGGIHVTDPGGYLQCHLDYALHPSGLERRLNLVLFLNPVWRGEWGGAFDLYDDAGLHVVKRVFPAENRAVLWEASDLAYHGTELVAPGASPRVTAAVYYLAQPRPGATRKRALFVPKRLGER